VRYHRVLCSLAAVVLAVVPTGVAVGQPLTAPVNPVRPVDPANVQTDPSHGFLVLVEGDAGLFQNETEGPVAVGGNLRFRQYNVGANNPGSYTLPGDTRPTSLVVGGHLDFPGSPPGAELSVLNQSYAKIGDLSQTTVLLSGGVTWIEPAGAAAGTLPAVDVQTGEPAAAVGGPSGFDFASLFATYRSLNAAMAECAQTVTLKDSNGQSDWNGTDPVATLGLQPGQNVLTLTLDQLAHLQFINPLPGAPQPGTSAWLVINVVGGGDFTLPMPGVSWQGNGPSQHVLWNFTTTGTITLAAGSNTVWGTVYAPNAALVDNSVGNIEGNVVVRTLTEGDPTSINGGEIHYAPFADDVTPCQTAPTTTTTPPVSPTGRTTTPPVSPTDRTTTATTTTSGSRGAGSAPTTTTSGSPAQGSPTGTLADTGTDTHVLVPAALLVTVGALLVLLTRLRSRRERRDR
jgi:choice-of-anchor A domain-containing protein